MAIYDLPEKFIPKEPPKKKVAFRRSAAQFGNGYKQVAGSRIFPKAVELTAIFPIFGESDQEEFETFLDDVGASNFIRWTPPGVNISNGAWRLKDGLYGSDPTGFKAWEYSLTLELENVGI